MDVFDTVRGVQEKISELKQQGYGIGFVPTMGALHRGHLSLVDACTRDNEVTVVSIFVNPTQFNQREDFEQYPRDLDGDIKKLGEAGANIIFTPAEKEMYPEPDNRVFDFDGLDKVMEGKHRPGHFNGVAQIVSRLFDIIRPHRAYFGEKDFQQLVIIRNLTSQLNLDIEIVSCPIVRESDGLARSSRNVRLTEKQRKHAPKIAEAIHKARDLAGDYSVEEVIQSVTEHVNNDPYIDVEYFEIVDEKNLQPIETWDDAYYKRACIAAWVGKVRLIDNVPYYF
ncbi:MAG: pantoate--beta-alanine ligase [Bacteroidales bacterium]|nr:pantoate--beta-alanine ligase [Bacteroidales bacterium]